MSPRELPRADDYQIRLKRKLVSPGERILAVTIRSLLYQETFQFGATDPKIHERLHHGSNSGGL